MISEYDHFAENFSETRQKSWPEFDLVKPYIKKNDRILDLGCGNVRLRKFLPTEKIPEGSFFGLDISRNLLKIAKQNFPKEHFFYGDFAGKLPFGADNFDFIFSIASFHHLLNKKDQNNFLQECHRILKPKGKIFITTWCLPKKYFWPNILNFRFKNWIIPWGKNKYPRTYRHVTNKNLEKLFKKNNFNIIFSKKFQERNFLILGEKK